MKKKFLTIPLLTLIFSSCSPFNVQNELDKCHSITGLNLPSSFNVLERKTDASIDSSFCYLKLEIKEEYSLEYINQYNITYTPKDDYVFDIVKETKSLCELYDLKWPLFGDEYDYFAYLTLNAEKSRFVDYFIILEENKKTMHYFRDVAQWKHGDSYHM